MRRSSLVLGASGFIGRHLARALAAAGHRVTGVGTRFPPAVAEGLAGVELLAGDLRAFTADDVVALAAGHDEVYHLAWSTVPATADREPERDLGDNAGLMIRLLSALRGTTTRLVFASSGGTVYGSGTPGERGFFEDDPLRPISAYGVAKVTAELYTEVFRSGHDVDARVARLSNPYGAGQAGSRLQGAVSRFTGEALAGRTIEMWGTGEVVRDYVHVDDAVDALICLGAADKAALGPSPVFNVASGRGTSLNGILAILEGTLDRAVNVARLPGRSFDVPVSVLDIGRARRLLGWQPRLTLEQGIARLVAELRADPEASFARAAA